MLVVRSIRSSEMETGSSGAQSKQVNCPLHQQRPHPPCGSVLTVGRLCLCVCVSDMKKKSYLLLTSKLMTSDSLCFIITIVTVYDSGLFPEVDESRWLRMFCVFVVIHGGVHSGWVASLSLRQKKSLRKTTAHAKCYLLAKIGLWRNRKSGWNGDAVALKCERMCGWLKVTFNLTLLTERCPVWSFLFCFRSSPHFLRRCLMTNCLWCRFGESHIG